MVICHIHFGMNISAAGWWWSTNTAQDVDVPFCYGRVAKTLGWFWHCTLEMLMFWASYLLINHSIFFIFFFLIRSRKLRFPWRSNHISTSKNAATFQRTRLSISCRCALWNVVFPKIVLCFFKIGMFSKMFLEMSCSSETMLCALCHRAKCHRLSKKRERERGRERESSVSSLYFCTATR